MSAQSGRFDATSRAVCISCARTGSRWRGSFLLVGYSNGIEYFTRQRSSSSQLQHSRLFGVLWKLLHFEREREEERERERGGEKNVLLFLSGCLFDYGWIPQTASVNLEKQNYCPNFYSEGRYKLIMTVYNLSSECK